MHTAIRLFVLLPAMRCSPACRPQTLGIYDLGTNFRRAAPDAVTLGQYFRRHGYHTESLGKIFHVGHGNQDDAESWSVPSWRPKGSAYAEPENAADAVTAIEKSGKGGGRTKGKSAANDAKGAAWESADVSDSEYSDGKIADEAILRLQAAQQRGTPFLLAVGFLKPHLPFVAPKNTGISTRQRICHSLPFRHPRTEHLHGLPSLVASCETIAEFPARELFRQNSRKR
jgi:iduronate 2-sulfatase